MACLAGPSFHEANGSCACVLAEVKATTPTSAAASRFCLPRRSAAKAGVRLVFIVLGLGKGLTANYANNADGEKIEEIFGNRGLPTKHTKATKALSRRFCFIGVLRVFRWATLLHEHIRVIPARSPARNASVAGGRVIRG